MAKKQRKRSGAPTGRRRDKYLLEEMAGGPTIRTVNFDRQKIAKQWSRFADRSVAELNAAIAQVIGSAKAVDATRRARAINALEWIFNADQAIEEGNAAAAAFCGMMFADQRLRLRTLEYFPYTLAGLGMAQGRQSSAERMRDRNAAIRAAKRDHPEWSAPRIRKHFAGAATLRDRFPDVADLSDERIRQILSGG